MPPMAVHSSDDSDEENTANLTKKQLQVWWKEINDERRYWLQELERKKLKNKKKKLSKKKAKTAGDSGIESQSDKDEKKKKEKPAEPLNEVRSRGPCIIYQFFFLLFSILSSPKAW